VVGGAEMMGRRWGVCAPVDSELTLLCCEDSGVGVVRGGGRI